MSRRGGRGGLLLPLVIVAGGVVLLLANFGVIELASLESILRLWPLLLIAVGLDVIAGRASLARALSSLLVVCILLGVGFAAFRLFAPDRWIAESQTVAVRLGDAGAARITLSCDDCALRIGASADSDALVAGVLALRRDARLSQSVSRTDDTVFYELASRPRGWFPFGRRREISTWELGVNRTIPVELLVSTGNAVDLDLQNLLVTAVSVTAEGGTLILSSASSAAYHVLGDAITLLAAEDVGVRVDRSGSSTPTTLNVPSEYVYSDSDIVSPNYGDAATRATILIRPGAGSLSIEPLRGEDETSIPDS